MYKCPKCNLFFERKYNMIRHQNKKYDCSETKKLFIQKKEDCDNNENDLHNFAQISSDNLSKNRKNNIESFNENFTIEKNNIKYKKNQENKFNLDIEDINHDNNLYICPYCSKNFSSKGTMTRHINCYCKIKKENDEERENIFKMLLKKDEQISILIEQNQTLIKEISNLKKITDKVMKETKIKKNKSIIANISTNTSNSNNINISNSNNTTNTQNNNIVMFNFGKEDLGIIDKQIYLDRVVKKTITGVKIPEEILKIIHFNPQYPQLSNIYISDINREKCMVWEDGEWKLSPVDKIPEVIDKVVGYSNQMESGLRERFVDNKKVNDRLDVVNKYIKMNDSDYLEELKIELEYEDNMKNKDLIKRCEGFQKLTYDTFKTTLYNEGKNLKKMSKS